MAEKKPAEKALQLIEMAWDPITRVVGSLGIHTTIDFANRRVVECRSTAFFQILKALEASPDAFAGLTDNRRGMSAPKPKAEKPAGPTKPVKPAKRKGK